MFTVIRLRNEIFWKFSVFLKFLRFAESLEVKIKIRLAMIRHFSAHNLDKIPSSENCQDKPNLSDQIKLSLAMIRYFSANNLGKILSS